MNVKDATCEVIDTSDTEEREILDAQVPGYYQKVWGKRLHTGVKIDEEKCLAHMTLFAPEPRTPSHKRIMCLSDIDPSPVFSRLRISPKVTQGLVSTTVTPATTPNGVMSNSESGTRDSRSTKPASSPLSSMNTGLLDVKINGFPVEQFELNDPSGDSLSLSGLLSQRVGAVASQASFPNSFKESIIESHLTPGADSAHDASNCKHDTLVTISSTSPSPPLEFTQSSSPDPLCFLPVLSPDHSGPFDLDPNVKRLIASDPDGARKSEPSTCTTDERDNAVKLAIDLSADIVLGTRRESDNVQNLSSFSRRTSSSSPPFEGRTEFGSRKLGTSPRSTSPPLTPPPPARPSSGHVSPSLSSSLSPLPSTPGAGPSFAPPSPITVPPDLNPPTRQYSLRHRSALQLNPFEIEKRMYKRQLRGMPEAIVKDPTAAAGRSARERHQQGGDEWGNPNDDEGGDNSDDVWRRERRREKKRRQDIAEEQMRSLGIVFPSDEEEDQMLQQLGAEENVPGGAGKRGKKRKRRVRARDFPMTLEAPSYPLSNDPVELHPGPRPRPILGETFLVSVPSTSRSASSPSAPVSPEPMHFNQDFGFDLPDEEATNFRSPLTGLSRKSSPIIVDEVYAGVEPAGRRIRRGHERENNNSDIQMIEADDTGDDPHSGGSGNSSEGESSEVEMTEKDRKRLKAMGRMMPAALVRKLLTEEERKLKKKNKAQHSEDTDEDEEDAPLQPGRGRKRIVSPGSKDPKRYEITGDPDSESGGEGEDRPPPDQEVINLVNSNSDGSDDTQRSLEENEDGLNARDIQTWLAPDLGYEHDREISAFRRTPRMHRPENERDRPRGGDLIDRMLQRTSRIGPQEPRPAEKYKSKPKVKGPRNPSMRPALDIVTKDASKLGAGGGRQTKLAFPKINKARTSGSAERQEHRVESRVGVKEKNKTRTHSRGAVQARLYIVGGNGRKVTSGRGRQIIHIDDNDDAFHEALAPTGQNAPRRARPSANNDRERQKNMTDILDRLRAANAGDERDVFDAHPNGQKHSHVTLDFDIPILPSGMTFGADSYMGKGRLVLLISVLNGEIEAPRPLAVTAFEQNIHPDLPVSEFSTLLASACDDLYNASITPADDPEMPLNMKVSEVKMHTLSQFVSFRAWCASDEDGQIAAAVAEQTAHLVRRINSRLEHVSADGHTLDPRSFALYWFVVELELRTVFARRTRRKTEVDHIVSSAVVAERYAVLLLRRLLEYGLDRTLQPLQDPEPLDITSPDVYAMELWARLFHLSPFFDKSENTTSTPIGSFWRMVEAAMDQQSNRAESSLDISEHLWRTMFSLCTISQFSVHGMSTSAVRLQQNWPLVSKALGCIRLGANEQLDHSKPASTLTKRDKYLRLVTARCLLLDVRYRWRLHDADLVFRALCAIFRSRKFSNLLGETSDFPTFIRDRDEPLFHAHTDADTAYGVFLKMIIRALRDFPDIDSAARTRKLSKLLGIAVPVGSMSFTKASPPVGQELSMLYNRYSAIIVAIYVEPTPANIHSRLQQVRRYINFQDADYDSQAASIRAMMNLAILLRHLNQPLNDVLAWASEMMNDLLDNHSKADRDPEVSQTEKDQLLISVQLLLGSVRMVIENPTLNRSGTCPAKYPDLALLREDWIARVLSSPSINSDHRTRIEIRKCIQSFLTARSKVIPPPPIPKPPVNQPESQDEYGDAGLDMDDPAVLALLESFEGPPDENYIADKKVSEIMSDLATKRIYSLVCKHLREEFDSRFPGSYFLEGDQWIGCWLGCASVAVRHNARDWSFYIKMAQAACENIRNDTSCRRRVYVRFMLTMLQLDSTSYEANDDKFLEIWFESIVSPEVTIEHEFNALLFSVGALRHGLFRNLPCPTDPGTGMASFDKSEFEQLRQSFIDVAVGNVAENLRVATPALKEFYIMLIEKMLKTLRESSQLMDKDAPGRAKYVEFCSCVHASVRKYPRLVEETALSIFVL